MGKSHAKRARALLTPGVGLASATTILIAGLAALRGCSATSAGEGARFPPHGIADREAVWSRQIAYALAAPANQQAERDLTPGLMAAVVVKSSHRQDGRVTSYCYGRALHLGPAPVGRWGESLAYVTEAVYSAGSGWFAELYLVQPPQQGRFVTPGGPRGDCDQLRQAGDVLPLLAGDPKVADRLAAAHGGGPVIRCREYQPVRRYDLSLSSATELMLLTGAHGWLRVWRRDVTTRYGDYAKWPDGWQHMEKLKWPCNELFRLLPSKARWWFLTAGGDLWTVTCAGKPDREVRKAQHVAGTILGTISDQDLGRSFIFGDGWYLDLGDEAKLVKEPKARWPRPAKDAPDIERLRVYRSWVGRP